MSDLLLACNDLTVDFGDFRALDHLDLRIEATGVTGLIGVNGAGKTTLIHSLTGLIPISEGQVAVVDGQNTIGYCPDTPTFEPWLSAREVLRQSVGLTGQTPPPHASVQQTLETVGLGDVGDRRVGGFSRGMKQRLGVAASLILKPRLLFLDEPTSALDPIGRDEMLDLIASLGRELHVVFSSHLLGDVEQVADSLIVIHRGVLRFAGPLETFLGASTPVIEITSAASPQRLRASLEAERIPATVDPESRCVLVPVAHKQAAFDLIRHFADDIDSVRVQSQSLQSVFRSEVERAQHPRQEPIDA